MKKFKIIILTCLLVIAVAALPRQNANAPRPVFCFAKGKTSEVIKMSKAQLRVITLDVCMDVSQKETETYTVETHEILGFKKGKRQAVRGKGTALSKIAMAWLMTSDPGFPITFRATVKNSKGAAYEIERIVKMQP